MGKKQFTERSENSSVKIPVLLLLISSKFYEKLISGQNNLTKSVTPADYKSKFFSPVPMQNCQFKIHTLHLGEQ